MERLVGNQDMYLLLKQTLGCGGLLLPDDEEVLPGLQRLEPNIQTDNHCEERAYNHHVSTELQPSSCHRHNYRGYCQEECDEDHNCVSDGSCLLIST